MMNLVGPADFATTEACARSSSDTLAGHSTLANTFGIPTGIPVPETTALIAMLLMVI